MRLKVKLSLIGTFLFFSSFALGEQKEVVHHPAPKEPVYLDPGLYSSFKSRLPSPPKVQSTSQKEDERELFNLQKSRSNADCSQAQAEVFVSLKSFYGKPRGTVNESDAGILSNFFEQVRNDGDFIIQKMKKDFPRQRPFAYIKGINPCVPKEVTGAYPSGHATLSKLYASILSDFFPADREKFEKRAVEIGRHRVLSGMHHPTDIESGRMLADLIYDELNKSKKYQAAFNEMKTQLKAK